MSSFSDPNLQLITNKLKSEFQPVRLLLYGSRSNNTHRPDSDYDFVMVLNSFDRNNRHEMQSKIKDIFRPLKLDVQVWTYSIDEFNDWKDEFSSIPETALNTGQEISLG